MPNFEYPIVLCLLLLLPVVWLIGSARSALSQHQYSNIALLSNLPTSSRQKYHNIVPLLYLLALAGIIIACAQPFTKTQHVAEQSQGIAISIVVDVSSSMDFQMNIADQRKPRMEIAKKALRQFVLGDEKNLSGRPNDLISVITFARYPDTLVPLTNAHQALVSMTDEITTSSRPNEDGTAFGDATALAAAQLHHYETTLGLENDSIKSKVVILLTDGENNTGKYDPLMAAAMAKKWGIKIYTISIADVETKSFTADSGNTLQLEQTMVSGDWVLQTMAQSTGGTFQRAHDFQSLQSVYEEINALETSSLLRVTFQDRQAIFKLPVLFSLMCFLLANILNASWLRKQV
ncbi:VWA domain-containing protein [Thalassotalea fonticola]|uniref:VWA domain-containing protein n=1 Tax=Thalassotalea fonticola TaxID=3065649 RepID=A0ABZ0GV30_9GAMM|nr:VWA domain-containing protein [Colwelliaceae bacterium S1-1]